MQASRVLEHFKCLALEPGWMKRKKGGKGWHQKIVVSIEIRLGSRKTPAKESHNPRNVQFPNTYSGTNMKATFGDCAFLGKKS